MYCTTCGKKLEDGEICSCKAQLNHTAPPIFNENQGNTTPPVFNTNAAPSPPPVFNTQTAPPPVFNTQTAPPPPPVFNTQTAPPPPPVFNTNAAPSPPPVFNNNAEPGTSSSYTQTSQQQNTQTQQQGAQTLFNNENIMKGKEFAQNAANNAYGFWGIMKNLLGVGEADENGSEDCFERNRQIAGDLIECCEGEVHVKQYHVANFRSRLQWLWAEGKIQVTNKRVILRASGRSIIGRTVLQQEYIIDEIAGVGVSKGVRFSFWDFILVLLLLFPICFTVIGGMVAGVFMQNDTLGYIIACILGFGALAPNFLIRKRLFFKSLCCASSAGAFLATARFGSGFFNILGIIAALLGIFTLFLFALKPSVSIAIMSKAGTGSPIAIFSTQHFRLENAKEILPAPETDLANKELGAIISDIQKFGDYGIEKWTGKAE